MSEPSAEPGPCFASGSLVNGRYRVVRQIGQGGMGRVYLVEDEHSQQQRLALKVLLSGAASGASVNRFCIEFAGLSRLQHPNIARAIDFGRIASTSNAYYTSEYVEGVDLYTATHRATIPQLVDLFEQTLRGLEFLHGQGYIHNDLKPSNVLVRVIVPGRNTDSFEEWLAAEAHLPESSIGRVKMIDFGLFGAERVVASELIGTPQFLSPERIQGLPCDGRSDLYSLGFLFYLVIARRLPFNHPNPDLVLQMHLSEEPPKLSYFRPDLPVELLDLIERLMKKAPQDRFQSTSEALEALQMVPVQACPRTDTDLSPNLMTGQVFGREKELLELEESFCTTSARASERSALVIRGPSGVGKTRLVRELRGLVQVSNGAFVEISCKALGDTLAELRLRLQMGLESSGLVDNAIFRSASWEEERQVAPGSSIETALLEIASRLPIVLHLDDFHRASPSIRSFALELAEKIRGQHSGAAGSRLFLLLSVRTDDWRGNTTGLEELPTIALNPFDEAMTGELIRQVFGGADIPAPVLRTITACSGGLPGRALEVLTGLVDGGTISAAGQRWVFPTV